MRGGENKKTLCRHLNALHSVSTHTQRLIRMLAEVPQVVYNNFRCEIESHCVGAAIACAGYGELALPIAAVLFLLLLKVSKIIVLSVFYIITDYFHIINQKMQKTGNCISNDLLVFCLS